MIYPSNIGSIDDFLAETFQVVLTYGLVFDANDTYVADVSSYELVDGTYARVALSGKTKNIGTDKVTYDCDDVDFGLVDNETVDGFIVYREVTNDLDSLLVSYQSFDEEVLDGLSSFQLTISVDGLIEVGF